MTHLLIPYVHIPNHTDPLFSEYTYGDVRARGKALQRLNPGDHIFFHTTLRGAKAITAFYVVERTLTTKAAAEDPRIRLKYHNPHITEFISGTRLPNDVIVFGDPITSMALRRPIPFDRALSEKLSLAIKFPKGKTEAQAIGQATRSWRVLSPADVKVLLAAARRAQEASAPSMLFRSSEEVAEIIEKDVEDHLARNPTILGKDLRLKARQLPLSSGRVDLLFQAPHDELLLVEVKLGRIGRDAVAQIEGYLAELRSSHKGRVRGAIVCAGVMPAFAEDLRKKKAIRILVYGWNLSVQAWEESPA